MVLPQNAKYAPLTIFSISLALSHGVCVRQRLLFGVDRQQSIQDVVRDYMPHFRSYINAKTVADEMMTLSKMPLPPDVSLAVTFTYSKSLAFMFSFAEVLRKFTEACDALHVGVPDQDGTISVMDAAQSLTSEPTPPDSSPPTTDKPTTIV